LHVAPAALLSTSYGPVFLVANQGVLAMLAKMTSKNQLTLPKSITAAVGATEYFDIEVQNGQIVLTPVRIQRGDAVRAKLAELDLQEQDIADAVAWARQTAKHPK